MPNAVQGLSIDRVGSLASDIDISSGIGCDAAAINVNDSVRSVLGSPLPAPILVILGDEIIVGAVICLSVESCARSRA